MACLSFCERRFWSGVRLGMSDAHSVFYTFPAVSPLLTLTSAGFAFFLRHVRRAILGDGQHSVSVCKKTLHGRGKGRWFGGIARAKARKQPVFWSGGLGGYVYRRWTGNPFGSSVRWHLPPTLRHQSLGSLLVAGDEHEVTTHVRFMRGMWPLPIMPSP